MSLDRAHDYLAIPNDYGRRLGGLRWCSNGEAVEQIAPDPTIGCTFAMAGEIALFLEGYATGGPLICFGFVLHLLKLLGLGASEEAGRWRTAAFIELAGALRQTGRPIRNAGALCALLCREVPRAADPPDSIDLGRALRHPTSISVFHHRLHWPAEMPPLTPDRFEAIVLKELERLTPDDVQHWLRHGRGPVGRAGGEATRLWTHDFATVLAGLKTRPRLAGAVPLVESLSGALALPPRRLARAEQPIGGYADIATRGQPEQILPAQFVLDDIEFLRRFAAHELLYFHREEPHAPTTEEFLIVLDQGVRTWGDVRLVLAAAALALVRRATLRKTPARLVSTGTPGRILALDGVDASGLGALLEASDLSLHPGAALQSALHDPSERPRDVVLLTHPRSVRQPEVAAAAQGVPAGTRLFALTVENDGNVELAELRHGTPVTLGRCRVEVRAPAPPEPRPANDSAARTRTRSWRGDVEPIGFPFRFGIQNPIPDGHFDFDDAGEWLLAAVKHDVGPLHAWRVDGTDALILPRPFINGEVMSSVSSVLGVIGGFVVVGSNGKQFIAAHYDFADRICNAHILHSERPTRAWWYLRHLHSIVSYTPAGYFALDLGVSKEEASKTQRSVRGCLEVRKRLPVHIHENHPLPALSDTIRLDPASGILDVQFDRDRRLTHTPQDDGLPALKGGRIVQARAGGDVVAAIVNTPRQTILQWFSNQSGVATGTSVIPRFASSFVLSRDGRRIALGFGDRRLEARDLGGGNIPRFVAPLGSYHPSLDVALGPTFLTIKVRKHAHLIRWDGPRFEWSYQGSGDPSTLVAEAMRSRHPLETSRTIASEDGHSLVSYDGSRFVKGCAAFGLGILVDVFGQIVVQDLERELVCMFFVFRDSLAAWLPEETRVGPLTIIGGPSTPDGQQRIARALRAAQSRAAEGKRYP